MSKYRYLHLPRGHRSEFPEIDNELTRRDVDAEYQELGYDGRVYRVPVERMSLLPQSGSLPAIPRSGALGDCWATTWYYPMGRGTENEPWHPITFEPEMPWVVVLTDLEAASGEKPACYRVATYESALETYSKLVEEWVHQLGPVVRWEPGFTEGARYTVDLIGPQKE